MIREAEAARLAAAFSRIVRRDLSKELPQIVARNKMYADDICATHDFCDANMLMEEAWLEVVGSEIDLQSDAEAKLWSDAWSLAKKGEFK